MSKKVLSAWIGAAMAFAGSLGYSVAPPASTDTHGPCAPAEHVSIDGHPVMIERVSHLIEDVKSNGKKLDVLLEREG